MSKSEKGFLRTNLIRRKENFTKYNMHSQFSTVNLRAASPIIEKALVAQRDAQTNTENKQRSTRRQLISNTADVYGFKTI